MTNEEKINFLKQNNVDIEKGIENMIDLETYEDILNDFYMALPDDLVKIDNFKKISDMPNYAILVHALKSNARSFGFNELGEIAYKHEMASKAGDVNFVNVNYDNLISEANKILNIIKQYKGL